MKHLAAGLKAVDSQMDVSEKEGPTVVEHLPLPSVRPQLTRWGGRWLNREVTVQLRVDKHQPLGLETGMLTPEQITAGKCWGCRKALGGWRLTLELCL